ncbi:MAG TPA: ornithine cyclodeaminase family protein [Candidatus Saccharimonadales bacterium]|jgi:ornithine cyclodeaminase/alanine dehydrogenase-like protein (mu-crystallin family)|nr:ornithine cyclodeaminase family protein [Candidatus Saccharimonadales bacterium]
MQFFSEEQIRKSIGVDELIQAIRSAFARDFHSTLRMPVRTSLDLVEGVLLLMPCHDTELHAAGVKMVSVTPQAGVKATYSLVDPVTGKVLAIMEANYLTDIRTAATSAVATDLLAPPSVTTLGIFGSGRQAEAHLSALPRVRSFERFLVCGSGKSDLRSFCGKMKREHGLEVEAMPAETCAREADVICACTTSAVPLFDGHWLRPGAHLNLVGAFQPHTREVDDETVRRSRVVVDTYEGALEEAGDLLLPISNGIIGREHVLADLHELAAGKKQVRRDATDITLFKSVGCALEDLVTALLIVRAT